MKNSSCLNKIVLLQKIKQEHKTMANKRNLKKGITTICNDLFIEIVANSKKIVAENPEKLTDLLCDIVRINKDYIARINCYDKAKAAFYFKEIKDSFEKEINDLVKKIDE